MEPCFNELSQYPLCSSDSECEQRVFEYAHLIAELKRSYGIRHIMYDDGIGTIKLKHDLTLGEYCSRPQNNCNEVILILSTNRSPYIDDKEVDKYDLTDYAAVKMVCGDGEKETTGAYFAYVTNSIVISFPSTDIWKRETLTIRFYKLDKTTKRLLRDRDVDIINAFESCQVKQMPFLLNAFHRGIFKLRDSSKPINEKMFNARDDHGKKELREFFDKIKKESYIEDMVNSLPFNPHYKDLIKDIADDGNIEFVLHWTDQGYGMVVSTTANCREEAKLIAALIKEKYDQ